MAKTPAPADVPKATTTRAASASGIAPTPVQPRTAAATTPATTAAAPQAKATPSMWSKKVIGIPVWVIALVLLAGGGILVYRKLAR